MTLGYYDDSHFYLAGFAASPFDTLISAGKQKAAQEVQRRTGIDPTQIPTSAGQARQMVEQRVRQEVQQQSRQVQRQLERQAQKEGVKLLKDLGQKVGAQEAQKLFEQTVKEFTPPSIKGVPVQPVLPKDASVGAIRDAAIETSLRTTEAFIQQKTGLPIQLPRKFNLEEIERTVTGLLPKDAKEALQLGISIGIQYASSALAGVVAGATIGSTIPGLGTVIGIGMGLAVQAIAAPEIQPHQKPCTSKVQCPLSSKGQTREFSARAGGMVTRGSTVPPQSPMEQLPWIAENIVLPAHVLSQERARSYCGVGPVPECVATMNTLARKAYKFAENTPQVLGLPQVNRYLPLYQRARAFEHSFYNPQSKRIEKTRGEVGARFIPAILAKLAQRQQALQLFVSKADRMEQLTPAEHSALQWVIINEMKNAAQQYALAPGSETQQWLAKMADYSRRWEAARQATMRQIQERAAAGQKRFETRKGDPEQQRKHVLQQLQFQCGQDNQTACAEYRRIAGGGALTPAQLRQFGVQPAPTRPAPAAPTAPRTDPALFKRCLDIVTALAKQHNVYRCLSRTELDKLARICVLAYQPNPSITPQKALELMAVAAQNACKRRGL